MQLAAPSEPLDIPGFLKDFLEFEAQNNLFSQVAQGRRFWDYLRYVISSECIYANYSYTEPMHSRRAQVLGEALGGLTAIARESVRQARSYDLMIVNYSRTNRFDGRDVNISSYPLIRHLAGRAKILLIDPLPLSRDVESLYPCDVMRSRPTHLLDRLRSRLDVFSPAERALFVQIGQALKKRYDVRIDIERFARDHFLFQLRRMRWYRRMLLKYRPKLILYCDNANIKGLIEAAYDARIPTADMQHSLISSSNILYRYPAGIGRLPTMSDSILTFGEVWNSQYSLPARRKAVGFPFFELKKKEALQAEFSESTARERSVLIVAMVFSKDVFVHIALALSKLLPDYTIYYKLRAEDYSGWRERYPAEFGERSNLLIIDSNETPLYNFFARCAFQIGVNSTALCEGMGFGLTTFILKTGWYREMEYFYHREHVFLVETAEEIADKIKCGLSPKARLDIDSLFKPNALHNLENEIGEIVAGGKVQ